MNLLAKSLFFTLVLLGGAVALAAVPTVEWVRQSGGDDSENSYSVAVDAAGNVYIGGYIRGPIEGGNTGSPDAFLAKFNSSGNQLWNKRLGTSSYELSYSIAVDAAGNAYITGFTGGSLGGVSASSFLAKFDSSGNELWIEQIGVGERDSSRSVAVDADGNVYISGTTDGSIGGINAGLRDAFLMKIDSNGNEQWTKQIGTAGIDIGISVAVDTTGNAYLSGYTYGDFEGVNAGLTDAFLAKFDSSGDELWTTQIGTNNDDFGISVAADAAGNVYLSGYTYGSLGGASAGGSDAFLAKFDSSGSELWAEQIGASGLDESHSVAVDAAGNAFISGRTRGSLGGANAGDMDGFLTKFDSSGSLLWTEQVGTSKYDASWSVAVDAAGYAYVTGSTYGDIGGPNAGALDAFLIKYRIVPEPTAAVMAVVAGVAGLVGRRRG